MGLMKVTSRTSGTICINAKRNTNNNLLIIAEVKLGHSDMRGVKLGQYDGRV